MDVDPAAPETGPEDAGWHARAVALAGRTDADPAGVCAMLEHAAVGLLHQPAASTGPARTALLLVDQAVAELADAGVTGPPPAGVGGDRVDCGQVGPLLAAAVAALPACTGDGAALLAHARAVLSVRRALDVISNG
jgi:hypothetical protein